MTGTWRLLARPVLKRAIALGVAIGIPAVVLSAGNGLRAVDVVAWLHRSFAVRGLLWAGWLVLSGPGLRTVFVAPGSLGLRALRLARAPRLLALFTLCAAVELPWLALFARGAGAVAAYAALTVSVALSAAFVSVWARPRGSALALCGLGALLVAGDPPSLLMAALGTLGAPFALHAAWRNALDQPGLRLKFTRPGSALGALYTVHLLRLLRVERSRLSSAFSTAAAGTAGVVLSLRNDPSERPVQRALMVMALPLIVAAAVCVAPLLETERRLQPLLRSLRARRSAVVVASLLAVSTPSSAFAAASGVVVARSAQLGSASLAATLLGWAALLGTAVALWGRYLERRSQRGVATFVAGLSVLALLATIGAYTW